MNKLVKSNSSVQFSLGPGEICVQNSLRRVDTVTFEDIMKPCSSLNCRHLVHKCFDYSHISPPSHLEIDGSRDHFKIFLNWILSVNALKNTIKTLIIQDLQYTEISLFSQLIQALPYLECLYIKTCCMDGEYVVDIIKSMKNCIALEIQRPYYSKDIAPSHGAWFKHSAHTEDNIVTSTLALASVKQLIPHLECNKLKGPAVLLICLIRELNKTKV